MTALSPYEQKALKQLRAWQAEPPSWGTRLMAKPGGTIARAVQIVVPTSALRAALATVDRLGRRLSDERSILQRAGVASLDELRALPLEACDRLARSVSRRAQTLGGAAGALFGIAGAAGLIADVPALLTLALRTIHRTGLCYGEKPAVDEERRLGLAIFALVSANSAEEKQAALSALRGELHPGGRQATEAHPALLDAAWRDGVERVAEREIAKEATVYSLQNLARSIGLNLGSRKAAGSVPVIGAAVGGAVNAWYVADVAAVSRYVFQERWLRARHGQIAS